VPANLGNNKLGSPNAGKFENRTNPAYQIRNPEILDWTGKPINRRSPGEPSMLFAKFANELS